jgi:hypothetical protein
MPRLKTIARLERTALADLWKHTLSKIPTVCGRLAYLASLRDTHSGVYKHHGLTNSFGRDEAVRALRESHEKEFLAWLNLSLSAKSDDLKAHLNGLDANSEQVVAHWLKAGIYRGFVPPSARQVETELFARDFEILLGFLRAEDLRRQQHCAVERLDRDSWPLA